MSTTPRPRAGFYVDGFNLYHAIDDLGKPYLKWLSLARLARRIGRQFDAEIREVVFCTAYFKSDFAKFKRHETYVAALQAEGVKVVFGHITNEPMDCKSCGRKWAAPREKETDINVALSLFKAAITDRVDLCFLVTADTDQAATLRFMSESAPDKQVVVLTPPGRNVSSHLKDLAFRNLRLSETDLDQSVLPGLVTPTQGRAVVRPPEYAPPPGWVHPEDRPKRP